MYLLKHFLDRNITILRYDQRKSSKKLHFSLREEEQRTFLLEYILILNM